MLKMLINRVIDDPHGEWTLIRRLLQTDGRSHLRGYALVLLWMGLAAGCTAAAAYLIGHAVNEAFVTKNFAGIAIVAIVCVLVYATKGISTYAQAVSLAKI